MRKLKIQVQISVDGFICGPNDEMDWLTWNWDAKIKDYVARLHVPVDTILLGRKMTEGFVSHWSKVVQDPSNEEYALAKKMVDTPKVVFSKTLKESQWPNTELASGDLAEEVNKLKQKEGGDIIVYGGASFDSSLIKADLIDEYYLFINPVAVGKGKPIFNSLNAPRQLKLLNSQAFECGIVVLHYGR